LIITCISGLINWVACIYRPYFSMKNHGEKSYIVSYYNIIPILYFQYKCILYLLFKSGRKVIGEINAFLICYSNFGNKQNIEIDEGGTGHVGSYLLPWDAIRDSGSMYKTENQSYIVQKFRDTEWSIIQKKGL